MVAGGFGFGWGRGGGGAAALVLVSLRVAWWCVGRLFVYTS